MRSHKRIRIHKDYNPDYCKTEVRRICCDYIGGGSINNPELSPLVSNDPILQQQCRTRGYMTIPIGGELRNVICGGTNDHEGDELKESLQCPICNNVYCKRHLSEHLDEPIYTSPRGREIRVDNPEIYIGKPDADLRTEMSSWDNAELNRNDEATELNRAYSAVDMLVSSIPSISDLAASLTVADEFPERWIQVKSMEEGGAGSGHFGHAGVPGERGGSAPSGRELSERRIHDLRLKTLLNRPETKAGIRQFNHDFHDEYDKTDTLWRGTNQRDLASIVDSGQVTSGTERGIVSMSISSEAASDFGAGERGGGTILLEIDKPSIAEGYDTGPLTYHQGNWIDIPHTGDIEEGKIGEEEYMSEMEVRSHAFPSSAIRSIHYQGNFVNSDLNAFSKLSRRYSQFNWVCDNCPSQ